MNLIPSALAEWFRGIRQRLFFASMSLTAEEVAAHLEVEALAIKKKRVTNAFEGIDFADELPTGGSKEKEEIVAAFKADLVTIRSLTDQVLSGRIPLAEGREALRDHPFESTSSGTSSPDGSKSIEDGGKKGPADTPNPPVKRGRGRPKKDA